MELSEGSRIRNMPPTMHYISNFITLQEEIYLLQKINTGRWVQLSKRRLQPHPSALLSNNTLLAAPLPGWLIHPIETRFSALGIFNGSKHGTPNHVLINEYQPGQGIMPHEDGGAYSPIVATVSMGAPIVLEVTEKMADGSADEAKRWRILQEERSLLVTCGDAYAVTLHGISEVRVDDQLNEGSIVNWTLLGDQDRFRNGRSERERRVSLTYRDVLKVSKAFGGMLSK